MIMTDQPRSRRRFTAQQDVPRRPPRCIPGRAPNNSDAAMRRSRSPGRSRTPAPSAASKGWTVLDDHIYSDDAMSGAEVHKLRAKQRLLDLIRSEAAPFQILIMQK